MNDQPTPLDGQNQLRLKELLRTLRECFRLLELAGLERSSSALRAHIAIPAANLQADAGIPLDDRVDFIRHA